VSLAEGPDRTVRRVGAGGRRIDSSRDAVILQAALDGLAERGYDLLTMDEIAARARAGKGAIYRRWPSKAALVVDAVVAWRDQLRPPAVPDTGSLRGDVEAMISSMPDLGSAEGRRVDVLVGLAAAASRDPELRAALYGPVLEQPRRALRNVLDRAVARGEIPAGRDLSLVPDVVIALNVLRFLTGEPPDRGFSRRVCEEVLLPLVTAPAPGPDRGDPRRARR
jgi:AcrR family transcriptional regulator